MKANIALACFLALASAASAALSFTPSYSGSVEHTHSNSDAVIGFDWGSDGKIYYATATQSYASGGLYRKDGTSSTELVAGSGSLFPGASVVAIGSTIYFNDSDWSNNQFIRTYTIGSGSGSPTVATNYALGTDGTNLFTTGSADWVTTRISYYANGNLGATVDLGGVAGNPGPVAVDSAGNLFYAPGFGDLSIYRWSAAEVAAAIGGGPQLSATGHIFADYSLDFPTLDGASSLAIDAAGNLFVTFTSFTSPSSLVRFDASGATNEIVATSSDRLGGLNIQNGQLYVADGNQIFSVIPEPSSLLLSLFALVPLVARRRR
jgi:hypothetical protein